MKNKIPASIKNTATIDVPHELQCVVSISSPLLHQSPWGEKTKAPWKSSNVIPTVLACELKRCVAQRHHLNTTELPSATVESICHGVCFFLLPV